MEKSFLKGIVLGVVTVVTSSVVGKYLPIVKF